MRGPPPYPPPLPRGLLLSHQPCPRADEVQVLSFLASSRLGITPPTAVSKTEAAAGQGAPQAQVRENQPHVDSRPPELGSQVEIQALSRIRSVDLRERPGRLELPSLL